MERVFKLKTTMEEDNWNAEFILSDSNFIEGVVFNETHDMLDIMKGFYDKSFGGCTFTLAKSKYKYVLYANNIEDVEYPMNNLNKKRDLIAARYDIYGNYSTVNVMMEPSEKVEINELKSAINNCKIKIYSNGDRIRRIK